MTAGWGISRTGRLSPCRQVLAVLCADPAWTPGPPRGCRSVGSFEKTNISKRVV